jgi:hypothetical protein
MLLTLAASPTFAQGTIAGVVKDATGAVLPGVTVEAASPVLIEKTRTAVTDTQGLYQIVDLRPGSYTVTFALVGFATIKREGVEVTASFTATINADLRVGSIEESVTVSGEAPTVDVRNVVLGKVVGRDVIDTIPTGNRSFQHIGVLIPGVNINTPDVGGTSLRDLTLVVHDSRSAENLLLIDGMPYNHGGGVGGARNGITMNDGGVQEISLEVGGLSAETATGGVRSNIIPKEGGNTYRGFLAASYSNHSLQSNNLTSDLQALGLRSVDRLDRVWDINPAIGGPLVKDKLWFHSAFRAWGANNLAAGVYYNQTPTSFVYTPDFDRQGIDGTQLGSENIRLTWQASPRNKINFYYDIQQGCYCSWYSANLRTNSPEAIIDQGRSPDYMTQLTWSSTVSSKLLVSAGATFVDFDWPTTPQPGTENMTPLRELSTNQIYRAFTSTSASIEGSVPGHNASHQFNSRLSIAYVTGSHSVKLGTTFQRSSSRVTRDLYGNAMSWQLLNGQPRSITEWAEPVSFEERLKANVGVYGQDQWTMKRLTMNVGVRFDYLNAFVPAQHENAGPFVPARDFAAIYNVPDWKDVSPRVGLSYDLFGNGKTALKATWGRYVFAPEIITFTRQANPAFASVVNSTRTWTDVNRDLNPDCDLSTAAANGECGALDNAKFGQVNILTRYDDAVLHNRGFNWETSAGVQHELASGVSVTASYYRRSYGNLTVTRNLAVSPSDFSPYCVTSPVDPRLPGGGGQQICGFYDVSPAKFGQQNNVIILAPDQTEVFNGVDLGVSARIRRGIVLSGGTSTGHTQTNNCYALNDPTLTFAGTAAGVQAARIDASCDIRPPFQTQFKFYGVYPLPWWGLQTSASYQSVPGPQMTASYPATNAQIIPTLGRSLAAGPNATATVDLIPPGTRYNVRLNQLDFRMFKVIKVGGARVRANIDLFNMFNGNAILAQNNAFGSAWLTPTRILQGRLLKFGTQIDF